MKERVVKIIEINDKDGSFTILDKELYSVFKRPMKIMFDDEKIEIEKPDIPICDICNDDAEYAVLIDYRDGEGEVMVECVCEDCKKRYYEK